MSNKRLSKFMFISFTSKGVPKMPMDTPRMGIVENGTMRLSWTPARIPVYAKKTPITYTVEKKEPSDMEWIPIIAKHNETSFLIPHIKPEQDYLFRVCAENQFGLSEPTLPAALTRSKGKLSCVILY